MLQIGNIVFGNPTGYHGDVGGGDGGEEHWRCYKVSSTFPIDQCFLPFILDPHLLV